MFFDGSILPLFVVAGAHLVSASGLHDSSQFGHGGIECLGAAVVIERYVGQQRRRVVIATALRLTIYSAVREDSGEP